MNRTPLRCSRERQARMADHADALAKIQAQFDRRDWRIMYAETLFSAMCETNALHITRAEFAATRNAHALSTAQHLERSA